MKHSHDLRVAMETLARFRRCDYDDQRQRDENGQWFDFFAREDAEAFAAACAQYLQITCGCLCEHRVIDDPRPVFVITPGPLPCKVREVGSTCYYLAHLTVLAGDVLIEGKIVCDERCLPRGAVNASGFMPF